MSFLFRRVVLTLLVPFLWKRWRERGRTTNSSATSRS